MSLIDSGCCCCEIRFNGVFYHFCLDPAHDPSSGEGEANDTVTITDHADPSIVYWTGTTASDGTFSGSFYPTPDAAAVVDVTATTDPTSIWAGDTKTITVTLDCGDNNLVLQVVRMGIEFEVVGCNSVLVEGVTIDISGPTTVSVGTTPANPLTVFLLGGVYAWTANGDRWAESTGSFTIFDCDEVDVPPYTVLSPGGRPLTAGPIVIQMTPADPYVCFCGYGYPVPQTLHASFLGADVTLTYNILGYFANAWTDGDPHAFVMDFPAASPAIACCSAGAAVEGVFGYGFVVCGGCGGGSPQSGIIFDGTVCPVDPADAATFGESEGGFIYLWVTEPTEPPTCTSNVFGSSGPPFVATGEVGIFCAGGAAVWGVLPAISGLPPDWGPFTITITE